MPGFLDILRGIGGGISNIGGGIKKGGSLLHDAFTQDDDLDKFRTPDFNPNAKAQAAQRQAAPPQPSQQGQLPTSGMAERIRKEKVLAEAGLGVGSGDDADPYRGMDTLTFGADGGLKSRTSYDKDRKPTVHEMATRPRTVAGASDSGSMMEPPREAQQGDATRPRKVNSPGNRFKQGATNALWGAISGLANSGDVGAGIGAGIVGGIGGAINPGRGKRVLYETIDRPREDAEWAREQTKILGNQRVQKGQMDIEGAQSDSQYRQAQIKDLERKAREGDAHAAAELQRIQSQTELNKSRTQYEDRRGVNLGAHGTVMKDGSVIPPLPGTGAKKPMTAREAQDAREKEQQNTAKGVAADSTAGDPTGWKKYVSPDDMKLIDEYNGPKGKDMATPLQRQAERAYEAAKKLHAKKNEENTLRIAREQDRARIEASKAGEVGTASPPKGPFRTRPSLKWEWRDR